MSLDLETTMLTVFGIGTPSPLQLALWRLIDGRPLGELSEHPDVVAAIGNVAALPVGERPKEVVLVAGVRTGKSLTAAGIAFLATQTVDVSRMGPGEVPRFSIVSLSRDLGQVTFDHLIGRVQAHPHARKLLVGEPTSTSAMFRHPSGKPVEVSVVAAAKAGASLVARWSAGVVFDEAPRMAGELDGIAVNLDDMIASVEGRLLPGAQIDPFGSAWAPMGPVYDRVQKHWGSPTRDLVVVRGTGPQLNPSWWTPQRCADLQRKNPRAYRTDVLGEFGASDALAFDVDQVEATRARNFDLDAYTTFGQLAVEDPSSGRGDSDTSGIFSLLLPNAERIAETRRDPVTGSTTIVRDERGEIVYRETDPRPLYFLHSVSGLDGVFDGRITGEQIVTERAAAYRRAGVERVVADQRESLFRSSAYSRHRIAYTSIPWTSSNKPVAIEILRRWLADGQLVIEDTAGGDRVRRQLLALRERYTASGSITVSARGVGVDDYASLLITAALSDSEGLIRGSPNRQRKGFSSRSDDGSGWG